MKKILLAAVAAMALVPLAGNAHEPFSQTVCTNVAPGAPRDCARVDSDTEFEDGAEVNLDGDDSDPRGDGTSDGYIHVDVDRDGTVSVYCESDGGYNYPESRPGGDADDANGSNSRCEP